MKPLLPIIQLTILLFMLPAAELQACIFPIEKIIPDQQLATMRGGMTLPNGLQFDFRIRFSSWLNQQCLREYQLDSHNLTTLDPSFREIYQQGAGNFVSNSTFIDFDGILNLVQNTLDNQVIDQQLEIDIDIDTPSLQRLQLYQRIQPQFWQSRLQ